VYSGRPAPAVTGQGRKPGLTTKAGEETPGLTTKAQRHEGGHEVEKTEPLMHADER
jgi:hypothetical protein